MTRVIETTVYEFDELNEKAKERARQWYRETSVDDNYYAEPVIDDAVSIAALIGIEIDTRQDGKRSEPCIYWSGFSSQGDGTCFVGKYSRKPDAVQKVSEYAPTDEKLGAIVARIDAAAKDIPGEWRAIVTQSNSRYSHSNTMRIDIEQETAENGDAPEVSLEQEKALLEALRSFADWIYRQLESAYDDCNSDESVDDNIRANEYEFDATGNRA